MTKHIIFALFVFSALNVYSTSNETKVYLRVVLNNLEKVESATYNGIQEGWAPGDTAASIIMYHYIKEYNNNSDSTIGASFVSLLQKDTTQMEFCYDGKMLASVNKKNKTIMIDSFNVRKLPFRPLTPSFFNYNKNIIKYALDTKDSITIKTEDKKEFIYCCITIFKEKQVEFFGKPYYIEKNPYDYGETTSKYEIWIDKSTDLPFKIRREMSHNISVEKISNVILNKINIKDFNAADYFQTDYTTITNNAGVQKRKENNLVNKKAHDWNLEDINNKMHSLMELRSKVVMIQFTSVSCGPCRVSIPFLNKLTSAYKKEDFDFVAIECTANNLNALKFYQNKSAINYKFLKSNKNILKDYEIPFYPVFYFLDENQVVKKVITGYRENETDQEIIDTINQMID